MLPLPGGRLYWLMLVGLTGTKKREERVSITDQSRYKLKKTFKRRQKDLQRLE